MSAMRPTSRRSAPPLRPRVGVVGVSTATDTVVPPVRQTWCLLCYPSAPQATQLNYLPGGKELHQGGVRLLGTLQLGHMPAVELQVLGLWERLAHMLGEPDRNQPIALAPDEHARWHEAGQSRPQAQTLVAPSPCSIMTGAPWPASVIESGPWSGFDTSQAQASL